MLVREVNLDFFRKHPEFFELESFTTLYAQKKRPEQSVQEFLLEGDFRLIRIWVVWEAAKPIGILVNGELNESETCWYEEGHVIYLGIKKKRALVEFHRAWNQIGRPLRVCLTPDEWNVLDQTLFNHVKLPKEEDRSKRVTIESCIKNKKSEIRSALYYQEVYTRENPLELYQCFDFWSATKLEGCIPQIVSTYEQLQLERFSLMGSSWRLKVQHSQTYYLEDTDEAFEALKQRWIEKGYTLEDRTHPKYVQIFKLPRRPKRNGKVKICIKYFAYQALDHKYNDQTIPYYRHVLKRHIVDYFMKDSSVLAVSLLAIDDSILWSHTFNRKQKEYGDLIYKHSRHFLKRKLVNKQHREAIKATVMRAVVDKEGKGVQLEGYQQSRLHDYLIRVLRFIARKISLEGALEVFNREFKALVSDYAIAIKEHENGKADAIIQEIHDKCLPYEHFSYYDCETCCTPSVLKQILINTSPSGVGRVVEDLQTIRNLRVISEKDVRKMWYGLSRKSDVVKALKTLSKDLLNKHEVKVMKQERREMKKSLPLLGLDSLKPVEEYLTAMRRYDIKIRFTEVRDVLTLPILSQMIKGQYECVFKAQTFTPSYEEFGAYLKTLLRGEVLPNPKRFFHQLRQIKPVQELVEGRLTIEEAEKVLAILPTFKQDPKKWEALFKLSAKVEQKGSPEFLMAGNASVCCMTFGAGNAKTYAKEKAFGILNLYYGDRVVGNSVLWMNQTEAGRFLVLDNIEIHPNYKRIKSFLKTFLTDIMKSLIATYECEYVVQGKNYNDFELYERIDLEGVFCHFNPVGFEGDQPVRFYSDAKYFKVIKGQSKLKKRLGLKASMTEPFYVTKEGLTLEKQPVVHPMEFIGGDLPF